MMMYGQLPVQNSQKFRWTVGEEYSLLLHVCSVSYVLSQVTCNLSFMGMALIQFNIEMPLDH